MLDVCFFSQYNVPVFSGICEIFLFFLFELLYTYIKFKNRIKNIIKTLLLKIWVITFFPFCTHDRRLNNFSQSICYLWKSYPYFLFIISSYLIEFQWKNTHKWVHYTIIAFCSFKQSDKKSEILYIFIIL